MPVAWLRTVMQPCSEDEVQPNVVCSMCGLLLSIPVRKTCCDVECCLCCELLAATFMNGGCAHCGEEASQAAFDADLHDTINARVTEDDESHEWPHSWRRDLGVEMHSCSMRNVPFSLRPAYRETFKEIVEARCEELKTSHIRAPPKLCDPSDGII